LILDREQYYIDSLAPKYPKIAGSPLGLVRSLETRKLMSEAKKGENPPLYGKEVSESTKALINLAVKKKKGRGNHPLYGTYRSLETREN